MPSKLWSLTVVLALGAAMACGDSTSRGAPVTPSVTVSPVANATGVSRSDTVMMTLDLAVDSASCASRFHLRMRDSTGTDVPGHMAFADGYRRMMFIPDAPLEPNAHYFAHMRDSVMVGTGMGGMGNMGGQHQMMMFMQPPAGAMRMSDGMGWGFTTGN